RLDPRRDDVRTEPIHGEHPEREQDAPLQLRHPADVLDAADHSTISTFPPAASIFERADALARWTRTVRFRGASPTQSSLTGAPEPPMSPGAASAAASTVAPSPKPASAMRFTISHSTRWGRRKPYFRMR